MDDHRAIQPSPRFKPGGPISEPRPMVFDTEDRISLAVPSVSLRDAATAIAIVSRALGCPPRLFTVYGHCPACWVFRCHLLAAPDGDELPRECLACGHTWTERLETGNGHGARQGSAS